MAKKYNTDEYKQVTTPANPTGGFNKLYFKADNKAYRLDSTGVETELGGSGGITIQSGTFIVNGLPTPSNTPTSGTDSDTYYSTNFNGLISIPDYTGTNPTPTLEITCTLFVKVNGINSPMIGQLSIGGPNNGQTTIVDRIYNEVVSTYNRRAVSATGNSVAAGSFFSIQCLAGDVPTFSGTLNATYQPGANMIVNYSYL